MSSLDWSTLTGSLASSSAPHGVTAGLGTPPGGGDFVYGFNTLANVTGVIGKYASPQAPNTNFNPTLKGAQITAAVQRAVGGGLEGIAVFLFVQLQGNAVTDGGYILGLSDGDPGHIELRKGALSIGLPDEAPGGANTVLARSTEEIAMGDWVHLRLEAVYNTNGDVVLNVFRNDLTANDVDAPVWEAIPGMDQFIDDVLGVNSGSVPYTAGRVGFGARLDDSQRRAYVDHVTISKQT